MPARAKPRTCSAVTCGGIDRAFGSVRTSTSDGPRWSRAARSAPRSSCGSVTVTACSPAAAAIAPRSAGPWSVWNDGKPGDHHLQADHAERAVVERDDGEVEVLLDGGEQLAHQHRQPAVAGHGDDLAAGLGDRRADRVRQRVGHRPVPEGADDPPAAGGRDVAGGPDVAHAGVDGDDGVVGQLLVEHRGDVLRVHRPVVLDALRVGVDDVLERLGVVAQHPVEEGAVGLLVEQRQQRAQGGADVALDAEVEHGAPSEVPRVAVDLHGVRLRQEPVVGEVGAEQHEQVGLVAGLEAGAVAQEPAHPHVVGVVVLDPLLAAEGVPHRRLDLLGQREDLVAGLPHPGADEQRHRRRAVHPLRQRLDAVDGRRHDRGRRHEVALTGGVRRPPRR